MTPPHPLLGVPVVVLHPAGWETGTITIIISDETRAVVRVSDSVHRTVNLSDEGTTWRRAGVEYPEKVPVPSPPSEMKRLAQAARAGYRSGKPDNEAWEDAASAVIAAYEAGRKTERAYRFAYQAGDGTWWTGSGWSGSRKNKEPRALFPAALPEMVGARMVRVPFRRRVKVKP